MNLFLACKARLDTYNSELPFTCIWFTVGSCMYTGIYSSAKFVDRLWKIYTTKLSCFSAKSLDSCNGEFLCQQYIPEHVGTLG